MHFDLYRSCKVTYYRVPTYLTPGVDGFYSCGTSAKIHTGIDTILLAKQQCLNSDFPLSFSTKVLSPVQGPVQGVVLARLGAQFVCLPPPHVPCAKMLIRKKCLYMIWYFLSCRIKHHMPTTSVSEAWYDSCLVLSSCYNMPQVGKVSNSRNQWHTVLQAGSLQSGNWVPAWSGGALFQVTDRGGPRVLTWQRGWGLSRVPFLKLQSLSYGLHDGSVSQRSHLVMPPHRHEEFDT